MLLIPYAVRICCGVYPTGVAAVGVDDVSSRNVQVAARDEQGITAGG